MKWAQVKWPEGRPDEAHYECELCAGEITDADKVRMIPRVKWIAEKPFSGTAGFRLNELYSPWGRFGKMAKEFLTARQDPETINVFVNTVLGGGKWAVEKFHFKICRDLLRKEDRAVCGPIRRWVMHMIPKKTRTEIETGMKPVLCFQPFLFEWFSCFQLKKVAGLSFKMIQ